MSYQFTSGFAPGEVKVFTIGTSQQVDQGQLHDGLQSIQLINGFDPDFPASAWFPVISGLTKDAGVPPGSGDEVRWYGQLLSGNTNSPNSYAMLLQRGGQTLWETQFTGYRGPTSWFRSDQGSNPDPNLADQPNTWKRVYHLDDWGAVPKGATNTMLRESPVIGMISSRINPFMVQNNQSLYRSNNGFQQAGLNDYHRLFAHSNISARRAELMPDLDLARNNQAANNQDRFGIRNIFQSTTEISTPAKWDENHVSGSSGYTLMGWQAQTPSLNSLGLASAPLRQARAAFNVLSLGQFQQANLSDYFWQPTFAFGNSEASPYVDRNRAAGLQSYQVRNATGQQHFIIPDSSITANTTRTFPNDASNRFLDLSFTLNENLWDRYFLSSIPQNGALVADNTQPLPNSRHRFVNSPSAGDARNFDTAAAHLENVGALNVNTTSAESWKALLTAFRNLAIVAESGASNPDNTVPVSRNLDPLEGPVNFYRPDGSTTKSDYGAVSTNRNYSRLFFGFRYLTDAQIQSLAKRIVDEVRLRGPFYSLADFVNRRLVSPDLSGGHWVTARTDNQNHTNGSTTHTINSDYDPIKGMAGINGALQRAINVSGVNGGVNYPLGNATLDRTYAVDLNLSGANPNSEVRMQQYAEAAYYLDSEHLAGVPAGEAGQLLSHSPGFVTQADLLAMIGPALTPRGDTFLIRTYGDTLDKNGKVLARAYLEAVVQRVVEPVTPAGTTGESKWQPSDNFGRKFKVVSLRWLNPEEV